MVGYTEKEKNLNLNLMKEVIDKQIEVFRVGLDVKIPNTEKMEPILRNIDADIEAYYPNNWEMQQKMKQ